MECKKCKKEKSNDLFEYENKVLCFNCLTKVLKSQHKIKIKSLQTYYTFDGRHELGDSDMKVGTGYEFCRAFGVRKIKKEELK